MDEKEKKISFRNFWIVLKNFTTEQKRKFLRFTTGSDRAPYVLIVIHLIGKNKREIF